MKKLLIGFLFILSFGLSIGYSQTPQYVNQLTVEWDAVLPIEPTDIISYQLWTDSVMAGIVMDGETDLLVYTFTFTVEGEYILGVSTKRELQLPSFTEIVYSDINWSDVDDPVGSTPDPFVVRYIKPIQSPGNLRLQ